MGFVAFIQSTINILVNRMAVNKEVIIPIPSVTENPRTGPEPKTYSNIDAMSVVKFASIMVAIAREYPAIIASLIALPLRNSSLILSKIRTLESTAIPIVKTIPAIPGKVRVA